MENVSIDLKPIPFLTLIDLEYRGLIKFHHSSKVRLYVSRKKGYDEYTAYPYKGRFGVGYIIDTPTYSSTRYSDRSYYIFEER